MRQSCASLEEEKRISSSFLLRLAYGVSRYLYRCGSKKTEFDERLGLFAGLSMMDRSTPFM
jgi:hypothetical protein